MPKIRLHYSVHTLNNQQLLPAGIQLSPKTSSKLIYRPKRPLGKSILLMRYGTIRQDLIQFMGQDPYSRIFAPEHGATRGWGLMKKVSLPQEVMEILDYFKAHDYYTYRHFLVVYVLSLFLARHLLTDADDLISEANAGPTHDIGKICVPLRILKKRKPLTLSERMMLDHHAAAGYVLICYYLQDTTNFAAIIARDHHERRDGSGYPSGKKLKNRMLEIVAVSDIYDALISSRPYRSKPYDNRSALEEITAMAQIGKLSWDVVKVLVNHNRKNRSHSNECVVSLDKRGRAPAGNVYGIIISENSGKIRQ
ncbi:MAG: HD domain-containing phosphohydrolase [Syntrophales bacterium]|jgi:HD-GYP domain-containing protein (c-di-GMP phosphodiesterase class II)